MKTLRCFAAVAVISLFFVLGAARTSDAGPITYSFSGVLGDCTIVSPFTCNNDLSGHTVVGQFTTDDALSTLLTASFTVIGGSFTWRILIPDPFPNSTVVQFGAGGLFIVESVLVPPPDREDFVLSLMFNSPLTPTSGSTLQSGFIGRPSADIRNPFVSGLVVTQVPEPSSVWLLATGLAVFGTVLHAQRRGAFAVPGPYKIAGCALRPSS